MESRWSKSISVRYPREREVELHVNLAGLCLNDEDALEWSYWTKSYLHHRRAKRTVASIDVSRNNLCEIGLAHVLTAAAKNLGGGVRKLRAHCNNLRSVPLQALLSCGESLSELHLSHNQMDAASIHALLTCLVRSERYPLDAKQPLWLRLEKNPGCAGDKLVGISSEHSERICVVDGHNGCTPHTCRRDRIKKPALHLTYLSIVSDKLNFQPNFICQKTSPTSAPLVRRERVSAWTPAAAAERHRRTEKVVTPHSRCPIVNEDTPLQIRDAVNGERITEPEPATEPEP